MPLGRKGSGKGARRKTRAGEGGIPAHILGGGKRPSYNEGGSFALLWVIPWEAEEKRIKRLKE